MMECSGLSFKMFSSLPVVCPWAVAKVPLRSLETLLSL
jgi:hypothetical protein